MTLKAPFPWFGQVPSVGMSVALDLIARGVLSIDAEGRIWRHAIFNHGEWKQIEPRRAENIGGKGYFRLTLQHGGRQVQAMAHRVVWAMENKVIPPDDRQINHDDLNKQNNRPANLILCTGTQNIQHSYANGRTIPWSKMRQQLGAKWRGRPIVSPETISAIQDQRRAGVFLKDIAREFGISVTHVHRLSSRGCSR